MAMSYRGVFEARPLGLNRYFLTCTGEYMHCGYTTINGRGQKVFTDWLGREWLLLSSPTEPPSDDSSKIQEIGEAELCEDC